jgi:hypothetical protein
MKSTRRTIEAVLFAGATEADATTMRIVMTVSHVMNIIMAGIIADIKRMTGVTIALQAEGTIVGEMIVMRTMTGEGVAAAILPTTIAETILTVWIDGQEVEAEAETEKGKEIAIGIGTEDTTTITGGMKGEKRDEMVEMIMGTQDDETTIDTISLGRLRPLRLPPVLFLGPVLLLQV